MRFEHSKKAILPFPQFLLRFLKFAMYSGLLIGFSIGIGIFGYHFYGNISWLDAFYNSSMILTGMGPVDRMTTNAGKWFASFYALYSGIAFLSTVAVFIAPLAHRFLHIFHLDEQEGRS
ncbi:MAG: hypothetical protein IPH04_17965 [Saprospirales bacterium]|jgi:hypothetical protein|nr:hypothetical protein [Saprospirales bacterium]MBK7336264.1 hypothetical protein [Saprospirales bacterium]